MSAIILNKGLENKISPKRRELFFAVMDGNGDLVGAMSILHNYVHCEKILMWLIENNYTGKNFSDLLVRKFKSSVPALVLYAIDSINRKTKNIDSTRV